MRLPGLSAEASLYTSKQTYNSAHLRTRETRNGVRPQSYSAWEDCRWRPFDDPSCVELGIVFPPGECPDGLCGAPLNGCPPGCVPG